MKKYLIALVVIILLAIIAGAIYLKLSKSEISEPVACTMEAKICPDGVTYVGRQGPKCEFAECPVAQAVDEMADWKTYKNEEYGFELKYPTNYLIDKYNTSRAGVSQVSSILAINEPFAPGACKAGCPSSFSVNVHRPQLVNEGKIYKDIYEYVQDSYRLNSESGQVIYDKLVFKEIFVNGIKGVVVSGIVGSDLRTNSFNAEYFMVDGSVISVLYRPLDHKPFKEILSTFKFTK